VVQKLTAIEADAMWADSSTNVLNAQSIAKHLTVYFRQAMEQSELTAVFVAPRELM